MWDAGRTLELPGGKPRAVLALLLLNVGQVVAVDRVIDEIWGENPPDTAQTGLHGYVSRLRRTLGPKTIATRAGGYALMIEPGSLDLHRFTAGLEEGRRLLREDPDRAAAVLREALSLWRGPPLADFAYEPFAQAEIGRLEELRVAALEERIEADLALGRHGDVIPELEALISRTPLRERLRGQLMLALYRSGRQAEALDVYQEARRALVNELGIEPATALQRLEQAILNQDRSLELPTRPEIREREQLTPVAAASADTVVRNEQRKTVTVLFTDLVRSTALWEELDSEVLRKLMSRYFETVKAVVSRHGGTVEKFIGDAAMAVFGVPVLHEDDALRAVRAAVELRDELAVLNEELDRVWGTRLATRTGVNTGEVIAGASSGEEVLVTGDPVNVAARLEQAAGTDEILIGEATWRLVRDAVRVEPAAGLQLRSRTRQSQAFRLLDVLPDAPGLNRRLDIRLVGRELELAQLAQAFERSARERRPYLVTVLGTAGVGKSRLAQEFLASLEGRAGVVSGRCLPYGDGITLWPVAEIVRQACGDEPRAAILELVPPAEATLVADRVEAAIGRRQTPTAVEETFWAIRRLMEELARTTPLVVVLEDLHWAEPTLLDLVEHLADWTNDAPVLILCLARPELIDQRPGWGGGKLNAVSILLQPLTDGECDELLESLLDGQTLDDDARSAVRRAAEGNPLFVEQMLALLAEADGEPASTVPPTIQALLEARLDRLTQAERAVIEAAAVVGKEFWRGAVEQLLAVGVRSTASAQLLALVRKQLLRPDRSAFPGEEGFRFDHILIQDAAYRAISKERRADMHEQFASWLERTAGPRITEYEEILGYHLEQASGYRRALGLLDERAAAAAGRAAEFLATAGHRAFGRGDMPAARSLLERAIALRPEQTGTLAPELAEALSVLGELAPAEEVLREAIAQAVAVGDARLETHARLEALLLQTNTDPNVDMARLLESAETAIATFERLGDDIGLAKAWRTVAEVHLTTCRWGLSAEALERALTHAERGGEERERALALAHLANAVYWGPTPVVEAVRRCQQMLTENVGRPTLEANLLCYLGGLRGMEDDFDQALDLVQRGQEIFERLGHRRGVANQALVAGPLKLLAGDAVGAEAELREAWETLESMGESGILPSIAAFLAEAVYAQGRYDEVEALTIVSEHAAAEDDVASQIGWRAARAKGLARRGEHSEAKRVARAAVELADETDFLTMNADAYAALAEVTVLAGGVDEAQGLVDRALALYAAKGNRASSRVLLERIGFVGSPGRG